jgi:hypothetical protein
MLAIVLPSLISSPLVPFEISPHGDFAEFMRDVLRCLGVPARPYSRTDTTDARSHYAALQAYAAPFRAVGRPAHGPCSGPFLEAEFIRRFAGRPLSSFGPFIPLFMPWFALWRRRSFAEYQRIVHGLFDLLRPEYLYVIVTESEFGVSGDRSYPGTVPNNVFILSASGVGHVALPWLECEFTPPKKRDIKWFISFCGNPRSSRERQRVIEVARALFRNDFFEYSGDDWVGVAQASMFGFAPRGVSVGAHRVFDLIRMETIPIVATDEMHWLPYFPALDWSRFAILTNLQEMPRTANRLRSIGAREIAEMRVALHNASVEFFQWDSFFKRLELFFQGGRSYFACSKAVLTNFT